MQSMIIVSVILVVAVAVAAIITINFLQGYIKQKLHNQFKIIECVVDEFPLEARYRIWKAAYESLHPDELKHRELNWREE